MRKAKARRGARMVYVADELRKLGQRSWVEIELERGLLRAVRAGLLTAEKPKGEAG
jgi:hypothetical protein